MTLITYKPRTGIVNEIDSWFDSLLNFKHADNYDNKFQPKFNISQNKASYFITADLPGIDKKNIDISISDDMLTISAERKLNGNIDDISMEYNNIQYGSFEKSFYIPDDANTDKIDAKMDNGVLTLQIKRAKEVLDNVKKISIK